MAEIRSPMRKLDLNNFDTTDASDSPYVLTSPRSLESCARLGVKPVELLIKSLNEFIAERHDVPLEAVKCMHDSYEKERRRTLQRCREERQRIINTDNTDKTDNKTLATKNYSALETVLVPDSRISACKSQVDHAINGRTRSVPYLDHTVNKSAHRWSVGNREKDFLGPNNAIMVSRLSLGELRHSSATEMQVERLTKDIRKEMSVTVSETDRKIAALMLVKHQEQQARLRLSQQEEQERHEARRQEEAQRAQTEKNRRKNLKQSMKRWHKEVEARRRLQECLEKELAGLREQEVLLQEERWSRLAKELEAQRREKIETARREAEVRKRYQERSLQAKEVMEEMERERERQVELEREQKAGRSRVTQERRERKRLQQENHRELLRHQLLKKQVEHQAEDEEAQMRSAVVQKLHQSWEKHSQAAEARLRELQERAALEEEQIQKARLKAKLQSQQQLTRKELLVQLSQRRMESAAQRSSAQRREKAERARQHNQDRQRCHQQLRNRVQRDEEVQRAVRESYLSAKERRRERLSRQREEIQEEARRMARASFHMRERVREQTKSCTFDQMALEAQLSASISRIKL